MPAKDREHDRAQHDDNAGRATLETPQGGADLPGRSLHDPRERYRGFLQTEAGTVWVAGTDGVVPDGADPWHVLTGQALEPFLGKGGLDALHPEDRPVLERAWIEARERAAPLRTDLRVRDESGVYRPLTLHAAPLLDDDGAVRGWVGLALDGEERQRTETRLRRSEERFRKVFEAAPVAVALTGRDDDLLDVNEAFEALTGYRRAELLGRDAKMLGFWSSPQDRATLDRALRGEVPLRNLDMQIRTRSGAVLDVLMSLAPVDVDHEGGYVKMLVDVTERRASERRLAEAIREAMEDTTWLAANVMERLAQHHPEIAEGPSLADLTRRERQVLELLARGRDNRAIAAALRLAPSTVRNYISALYEKLNVGSRAEAVVWARDRGLGGG